jgi:UDP-N-acetylmuramoyl-tripeptide--D-alanyl-D-alanine ligase
MAEVPHVSRRLCDTGAVTDTRPREPRPGVGPLALTAIEISEATGGRLVRSSDRSIRGAAVDSRAVAPGNLFVALPGETTDGHRFLGEAISAGAAALLVREADWSAGSAGNRPSGAVDAAAVAAALAAADRAGVAIVAVPDTLTALHAVAAAWRGRFSPLVVGVTGSIAKTSTKEAVAAVLGRRYTTLKSEGNANNEIGLPLTVLRMGPEHEAAVLEMGMYVGGEIARLAAIARPRIGVVTTVREVHLSRIGSIEAVERAKAELVEALPADGMAILNADDVRVAGMRERTAARTTTYGFAPEADVRAEDVASDGLDGMRFSLITPVGTVRVSTPALGRHGVHNGLAAAAVGLAAGLDLDRIAAGLAIGWQAQHRDQIVRIPGLTILDDTYNASPASMLAAMELLSTLPGRHVAVLGEMFELGDAHERGNREVGVAAVALVDLLVVVGEGAAGIAAGAAKLADRVVRVPDRDTALSVLRERLRPGDAVLVKASRGAALELLVASLADEFGGWIAGPEAQGGAHPSGEEVK